MSNITIIEAEERTTPNGKKLKKLHLLEEGKQYPFKMVTVWEDHPEFMQIVPGYKLQGDIVGKDSDKINPHNNKPYVNRTLYPSKNENGTIATQPSTLEPRLVALEEWAKTKGFGTSHSQPVEKVDYPEEDSIDPNDIPF